MRSIARTSALLAIGCVWGSLAVAQTPPVQQPPVPRPFPGATTPAPVKPADAPPTEATLGTAPVYPTAEFLDSFDAGQGQRYYLYGTNTSFETVVTYYRSVLRTSGRELFRTPAMHQFDLGRFDENRMVYPPSVVVKDYSWNNSPGYLHVDGTAEKRFLTIIQIVPVDTGKPPVTR